jgi:DNA-binding NarL/FixJ family response regulator
VSTPPTSSAIRVLLVDDHELVRAGLRALLTDAADIEVVGDAANGGQALAKAQRLRPDVVLLDAHLPDMPGPAVCRALAAALPGVAVAMLTTFTEDDLVRHCVRAGARGYLLKAIPGLDLAASIRALAAGESVVDHRVLGTVLAMTRPSAGAEAREEGLSERQREILRLVADGLSNREIAEQVHLSELTVEGYIEDVLKQLGAHNRVHAAVVATQRGWL